ncbi:MAG: helix-turn-helix domain-containing protein [Alphaproteobacteria bacterium]|nr:helix-turn-helix domain-containing protein [Alphaproteobacteria bacterium]
MSNQTPSQPPDPDFLDRLLTERETAQLLGYTRKALQKWRSEGGGPRYIRVSCRSIRYRRRDLLAWIEQRVCANTIRGRAVAS